LLSCRWVISVLMQQLLHRSLQRILELEVALWAGTSAFRHTRRAR